MFDLGFWELLLIGVVGLLVIGPERLPTVATHVGQWVGRLRRFANHMRSEIQQELEAEHLKQVLDEQNREMQSLRDEVSAVRDQAATATREAEQATREAADAGSHETGSHKSGRSPAAGEPQTQEPQSAPDDEQETQQDSGRRPARDGTSDD